MRELFPDVDTEVIADIFGELGGDLRGSIDALAPLSLSQSESIGFVDPDPAALAASTEIVDGDGFTDDLLGIDIDAELAVAEFDESMWGVMDQDGDNALARQVQEQEELEYEAHKRRLQEDFMAPKPVTTPQPKIASAWGTPFTQRAQPAPELLQPSGPGSHSIRRIQETQEAEQRTREQARGARDLPFEEKVERVLEICDYNVAEGDVIRALQFADGDTELVVDHLLGGKALATGPVTVLAPGVRNGEKVAVARRSRNLTNSGGNPQEKFERLRTLYRFVDDNTLWKVFSRCGGSSTETMRELSQLMPHLKGPAKPRVVYGLKSDSPAIGTGVASSGGDASHIAQAHQDRRIEYLKRATECFTRGDHAGAERNANMGRRHELMMQQAHQRACSDLFGGQARVVCAVDLHGRFTADAVNCVHETVRRERAKIPKGGTVQCVLRIITGRGAHSVGGEARIKPAVISFLKRSREVFADNGGEVLVRL